MSNWSSSEISQTKDIPAGPTILSSPEDEKIIFDKQARHLSRLLEKNGFDVSEAPSYNQLNGLVGYLSTRDSEARIRKVAKALLRGAGEYGSGRGEYISTECQVAVIAAYINRVILGVSLYKWIAIKIQQIRLYDLHWFNNKYLKRRINGLFHYPMSGNKLSLQSRTFYQDKVLKKLLPTLTMQLTEEENKELHKIDITQPRWGFIHAGALLLNELGGLSGSTLEEIEDIGITLHAMLCEGAIPTDFISYFTLPAMIYYARHVGGNLSMLNEEHMQVVYYRYFRYTKQSQKRSNPFVQLSRSLQVWKTRKELAKYKLYRHDVSDEWLTSYLNKHDEFKIGQVTLPNIDTVFNEQNRELAEINCEIEKILLSSIFISLSETEQQFIEQAKVEPENTYVYDSLYQLVSTSGRETATNTQESTQLPTCVVPLPTDGGTYTCYTRNYRYDRGGNLIQIRHSAPATGNTYTKQLTVSDRSNRAVLDTLSDDASKVDDLFDQAGHQLQVVPGQALTWTGRGELRQVTLVDRDSHPDVETYRYDGGSQRVMKRTVQQANDTTRMQRTVYLPGLELRTTQIGETIKEALQTVIVGEAGRAEVRALQWEKGRPVLMTTRCGTVMATLSAVVRWK